jgi:predicted O-linked N-acetylglucosamine transferase (SPINDLY family)
VGLPERGFVFCACHSNKKISPEVFDIWMRLLAKVSGSVLWLFLVDFEAAENLKAEAVKRGIATHRLIFAPRTDALSDHLARLRLADLFLDTLYWNAHSTASEVLWAGLPVLTLLGETFAGRVGASLLYAIGLPELVAHTLEEYQDLALTLATDSPKLVSIKERLAKNRSSYPLFDTKLFAMHIESAYMEMWARHQNGLVPDHIFVQNLGDESVGNVP